MTIAQRRTKSRISKADMAWLVRTFKACVDCGTTEDLTGDHVVPIGQGGRNLRSNLSLRCKSCNSRKGRLVDRADRQPPKVESTK